MTLRGRLGPIAAALGVVAAVAVAPAGLPGAADGPDPGWAETRIEIGPRLAAVLARDFDRDGALDLVVANHETSHLTLLFGAEGGGLVRSGRSRIAFDVPELDPFVVVEADVNGDGLTDVVVTSYVGGEVALLLGDDGPVRMVRIPVEGNPYAADIGDFDGDGRADFVTSNDGSGDVSVFLATGGDRER